MDSAPDRPADVLIVGGGLGGARTARALRELGFPGRIRLLSDEAEPPYDRPPLSKDFLLGNVEDHSILLLDPRQADELGIELSLDQRAVGLDVGGRRVLLAGGGTESYGSLVIATGARPRRLSALDPFRGVHYVRTVTDARALRDELARRPRVAIVGGGFIGLEVAAAARTLGCDVTVVEALAAPLAAITGAELGRAVQRWHEDHGVRFRCGGALVGARGDERVQVLELADGNSLPVDLVVVGVGVEPNAEWLEGQLSLRGGVVCDGEGRTSEPGVYALGDVSCRQIARRWAATAHWTATSEQALRVANAILGHQETRPAGDGSYFWSDQYDARLQFVGEVRGEPDITIATGGVATRKFVALCHDDGGVTAVFAMNSPREFAMNRRTLSAAPVSAGSR